MLSRLLPPEYKCLDEMGNQESTLSGDSIVQGVSSGISITGANSTDLPVDLNIKDAATTNVLQNGDTAEPRLPIASSPPGTNSCQPLLRSLRKRKYDQIDSSPSAPALIRLNERFHRDGTPARTDPPSPPHKSDITGQSHGNPRHEYYQVSPPRRSCPSDGYSWRLRQNQYDAQHSNSCFDSFRPLYNGSDKDNRAPQISPMRSREQRGKIFFKNKVWRSDQVDLSGNKGVPNGPNTHSDILSTAAAQPSSKHAAVKNSAQCQEQGLVDLSEADVYAAPGKLSKSSVASPLCVPSRPDRDDSSSILSEKTATSSNGSASKKTCHVCRTPSGLGLDALVHCSSCPRRYHRRCHTSPAIPKRVDGLWQCRRCVRKNVEPKESFVSLSKRVRLDVAVDNFDDNAANLASETPPESTASRQDIGHVGYTEDAHSDSAKKPAQIKFNVGFDNPKVASLETSSVLMREHDAISQPTEANSLMNSEVPETPEDNEQPPYGNKDPVDADTDSRQYTGMELLSVDSRSQAPERKPSPEIRIGSTTASKAQPLRASEHASANVHLPRVTTPVRTKTAKRSRRAPTACTRCMKITLAPGRLCIECQSSCHSAVDNLRQRPFSPASQLMIAQKASSEGSKVMNDDELDNSGPAPLAAQEHAHEVELDFLPKPAASEEISARLDLPDTSKMPKANSTEAENDDKTTDMEYSDPPVNAAVSCQSIDQKRRSRRGGHGLGDSFRRPKNVLTKLIQLALCTSPLQARGICAWIVQNIPGYQHGVDCWESSIGATISMNVNNKGNKLWISRPWKEGDSEKYGKGQWLELAPGVAERCERWDPTLKELVSPPRIIPSDDEGASTSIGRDFEGTHLSHELSTATMDSSIVNMQVCRHQDPENGTLASADQPVATVSSDDGRTPKLHGTLHGTPPNKTSIATNRRSKEHMNQHPQLMLKPTKLQEQETMQEIENFKWSGYPRLENVSDHRPSEISKHRPLHDTLHLASKAVLANFCKTDAKNQDFSVKILYKEWPEYDPANDPKKAKVEEIKTRPSRKQMIGKPASYSRLGTRAMGKPSDMASSRSPRKLLSGNIEALQKKFASLNDKNVSYCDTLESFFDLPQNPIPIIYQGELAYRDGTTDGNGKMARPRVIYKTG